ncbi:MAG: GGDEF domain-containing protein [Acidobacteria bacterium]|nr:GGDEF domain-containing protein [Acidobacteriota bacterium]
MLRVIKFLAGQSKPFMLALSLLLVLLIGLADYLAGPDISLLVFFMLPIFLAVWFVGKRAGLGVLILSGAVWTTLALTTSHLYSHPSIPYWNILTRLSFILIFANILTSLKKVLEHEQELARTDYLTGVANRRYFYELADMEIKRARRHERPFSVTYMDIDDFKEVNDRFGHSAGDMLLRTITETIKSDVRSIDTVTRLGGDEFAILMPETGSEAARAVVNRIQKSLLKVVRQNGWPVTFSIGVATWTNPPRTVDEMVKRADTLMYAVKGSGKNRVGHEVFGAQEAAA